MNGSLTEFLRSLRDIATGGFASDRVVTQAGRYGRLGPRARHFIASLRQGIDVDTFAEIERRRTGDAGKIYAKYLNLDTWLGRHLTHAEAIGLFAGPPRRILDIGTGNGYFPYICTRLGHDVVATDVDSVPLFDELVSLLEVRRIVHAVETFRPLPDLGGRFDLVTAFNTVFDRIDDATTWTPHEWTFFLDDLRTNLLSPDAEIVLKLNPNRTRLHDKSTLASYFRSLGGDVEMPFIHLRLAGGAFVPAHKGCRVKMAA